MICVQFVEVAIDPHLTMSLIMLPTSVYFLLTVGVVCVRGWMRVYVVYVGKMQWTYIVWR